LIPITLEPRVKISRVGAVFPDDLKDKEWKAIWKDLQLIDASLNWVIGDWINYGKAKYGEKYAFALEATEWQYQRLRDAAYVCAQVPMSLRNDNLDWWHHRVVAPLEPGDQAKYLTEAEANDWTVSELRISIRRAAATKKRSSAKALGFVPAAWIAHGLRWFRQQDFDDWPPDKREALRALLKPLVDIYRSLDSSL
jgi:hypothetical protein